MLPSEAIKEFQEIYSSAFGQELPDKQAAEQAEKLLQLIDLISRGDEANYATK